MCDYSIKLNENQEFKDVKERIRIDFQSINMGIWLIGLNADEIANRLERAYLNSDILLLSSNLRFKERNYLSNYREKIIKDILLNFALRGNHEITD